MFGFIKKRFFAGLTIVSSVNLQSATLLKCVSMTNQECKVRLQIVNVNSDEPIFYHFSKTSHNINDPYKKLCVPDFVKNLKVFNLMLRTNETRHI